MPVSRLTKERALLVCVIAGLILLLGCGSVPDGSGSDPTSDSHATQEAQIPAEHEIGEKIYAENCGLCHDHGEAGSPRIGVPKKWAKRIAKGEETLTKNAFEGFEGEWGEMPPQGDDLPREQVAAAVRYMIYRHEAASAAE